MDKSLFRVKTRGCGVFHVIATTFDHAAGEVTRELNDQDYGYSGDRVVTNVELICRETFMQNGKRALYGDNDEERNIALGLEQLRELWISSDLPFDATIAAVEDYDEDIFRTRGEAKKSIRELSEMRNDARREIEDIKRKW